MDESIQNSDLNENKKVNESKLNRAQRRQLNRKKHRPAFTKSFSKQNCVGKNAKQNRQRKMMRKRIESSGDWEDLKWIIDPNRIKELKEYKEQETKKLENI